MTIRCFVLIVLFTSLGLKAQNPESIIDRYFEVTGGKGLYEKATSFIMKGEIVSGDQKFSFTEYKKKPNKVKDVIDISGMKLINNAYNGEYAWVLNPMAGSVKPQKLLPEQAEVIAEFNTFESPLIHFSEKGYKASVEGVENVGKQVADVVKLVQNEGDENLERAMYFFFDKGTGFLIKQVSFITQGPAKGARVEVFLSDYKNIGNGLLMPFKISQEDPGLGEITTLYKEISYNPVIDDKEFNIESAM